MWMTENRRTPRAPLNSGEPVACQVQTLESSTMTPAELRDLSEGGASLRFRGESIPWHAGQQVIVRFQLPGGRVANRMFGEIRHARRSPDGEYVVGIQFGEDTSPSHFSLKLAKIRQFVLRVLGRSEQGDRAQTAVPGTSAARRPTMPHERD